MEKNCINLEPVWHDNYTAIAMSSSNEYVPYLSVCLQSLVEHTSNDHNYDIVIFECSITDENKRILKEQCCKNNVSLRFISPMSIISKYKLKFPSNYSLECYFRLTAPLILKNFSKIIFTDVDLIFLKDIKYLYQINVSNALGACQDLVYCAFLKTPNLEIYEYATKNLKLKDPYKYFNTGVMLLNLDYWRKNNITSILLEMANEKMYRILEQDVLNKYFQEDITYLDDCWNFPTMNSCYLSCMNNLTLDYKERYNEARKKPAIIHWAGRCKAWNNSQNDLAYKWWQYARKTPYYEVVLHNSSLIDKRALIEGIKYRSNILIYWKYKLLVVFTFGKTKEHYREKKALWKDKVRLGKIFRKGI